MLQIIGTRLNGERKKKKNSESFACMPIENVSCENKKKIKHSDKGQKKTFLGLHVKLMGLQERNFFVFFNNFVTQQT